jgi:predicted DCC family thiol-disulfide oxidoreductase YuxK
MSTERMDRAGVRLSGSSVPARAPGRALVVYDGACAFCRASIDRIRKLDRKRRFDYVPRETRGLEEAYPQLDLADFDSGLRLLDTSNQVHVGADAIYQILRKLPPYGWAAWVYRLPIIRGLSRRAYAWVAAHRMELARPCASGSACRLLDDAAPSRDEADPQGGARWGSK